MLTKVQQEAILSRRVLRGARLLDDKLPGWEDKVNLGRLDLTRPDHCLLGQCYGDYLRGQQVLEIDTRQSVRSGFYYDKRPHMVDVRPDTEGRGMLGRFWAWLCMEPSSWEVGLFSQYTTLTRFWRAEIKRRRDNKKANAFAEACFATVE